VADASPPSDLSSDDEPIDAGRFSTWLDDVLGALRGEHDSDVPCNGCTACCTSYQFVHIEADEVDTLAHIPSELLFPAPRLPIGNVLMGYDKHGHCPMLVDQKCTIYEHRPRTCRTYDCRIFPATGVELEGGEYVAITRRTKRWRFEFPEEVDRAEYDAVRAAAEFVRDRVSEHPDGGGPVNPIRHAVLALEMHERFLPTDPD
jgi:Fe-S-cluster containining protein